MNAKEFLRNRLAGGPVAVTVLIDEGKQQGISEDQLKRAKLGLPIKDYKDGSKVVGFGSSIPNYSALFCCNALKRRTSSQRPRCAAGAMGSFRPSFALVPSTTIVVITPRSNMNSPFSRIVRFGSKADMSIGDVRPLTRAFGTNTVPIDWIKAGDNR